MKKGWILLFLLLMPSAIAIDSGLRWNEFTKTISLGFRNFEVMMQNPYIVYGVLIIASFVLFYGIFSAAIKKVMIFEGEGGLGLNTSGKLVCVAISSMSTLAIFSMKKNILAFLKNTLPTFSIFGAFIIAIIVFLIVSKGFKDQSMAGFGSTGLAALAAAIVVIAIGIISLNQSYVLVGIGFLIITVLLHLVARGPSEMTESETEKVHNIEKHVEKEQKNELKDDMAKAQLLTDLDSLEFREQESIKEKTDLLRDNKNILDSLVRDPSYELIGKCSNIISWQRSIAQKEQPIIEKQILGLKRTINLTNHQIKSEEKSARKEAGEEERIKGARDANAAENELAKKLKKLKEENKELRTEFRDEKEEFQCKRRELKEIKTFIRICDAELKHLSNFHSALGHAREVHKILAKLVKGLQQKHKLWIKEQSQEYRSNEAEKEAKKEEKEEEEIEKELIKEEENL